MSYSSGSRLSSKGIALQMIKEVVRIYQLTYIEAETDDGAVEFL